jgi:LPS export ABC transporter protein LptC
MAWIHNAARCSPNKAHGKGLRQQGGQKTAPVKNRLKERIAFFLFITFPLLVFSCSFDYGNTTAEDKNQPDIVMRDVEYVRIRGGDPVVRFQAEEAERYEEKQTMNLKNFSFEQFENHGGGVNATGNAGQAQVELDSGNIRLEGGVEISVDSEDITIKTFGLSWQDKDRHLRETSGDNVEITRSDGTSFSGRGFFADARYRTWNFDAGVGGSYTEPEKEEEAPEEAGDGTEDNEAEM